jgi:hypothetical protein
MSIHADVRPFDPDDTTVNAPAKSRLPRWPYLVLLVLVIAWAGYYQVHSYKWKHSLSNPANPIANQSSFVFPLSSAGSHASFVTTTNDTMYSLDPIARTINAYRKGRGDDGWLHGTTTTIKVPLVPVRESGVPQPLVGLAATAGGVIYTVDVANQRVVRVDTNGHVNSDWTTSGIGAPIGVVVTKTGNIDVLNVETRFPSGLLTSITRVTPAGKATVHWAVLPGMGSAIVASTLFDNVYVGHAGSVGPDRNTIDVVLPDGTLWTAPITVPATAKLGDHTYAYDPAGVKPYGVDGPGQYLAEYNGELYVRYDATGSTVAALPYGGGSIQDFRHLVYQSGQPAGIVALTFTSSSNASMALLGSNAVIPLLGITTRHDLAVFRHAGSGF